MTHSELVEAAYRWVLKRGSCGIAFKELNTGCCNGEYPDVIGFGSGTSTVIECKTSRADFFADQKKSFRMYPALGMGRYRYYCCLPDLIKVNELTEGWGLLCIIDGKVKRVHNPYGTLEGNIYNGGFTPNLKAEHELMYSALRRLFIKGLVKAIYDKDYRRPTADDVIEANK